MKEIKRSYKAHPTVSRFHHSGAFHRGIRGPRGSGKSTGCCIELFRKACQQLPGPDGVSRSRWVLVRNTYRELEDTTLKTWLRWFPEDQLGKFNFGSMTHRIHWKDPAGRIDLDAEFLFRALDRPQDVKKTLSLELTGAYINEAKEVPFGVISGLDDAVGRYPERDPLSGLPGPTWQGTLLDTNAPDDDHWWYNLEQTFARGDLDPDVWAFFVQPGGLVERNGEFFPNPAAENLAFIGEDYYTKRMVGKKLDHVRVYYCNQFGFVLEGKPVHPEYVDAVHCWHKSIKVMPDQPVYVGIDFGLTPAALFGQINPGNGRWHALREMVTERMGVKQFARDMKPFMQREFPGCKFILGGDPSGSSEVETDENTCFRILNAEGIPAVPAYRNNDTTVRRAALSEPLSRLIDGKPGMIVSPECEVFRKGMKGGFNYKRKQIAGSEQFHDKPDKNKYSHICEAGEYMCLVGGEGVKLVETPVPEQEKDDFAGMYMDVGDNDGYSTGWMGG